MSLAPVTHHKITLLTLMMAASVLGGCSVTPDYFSPVDKMDSARQFMKASTADMQIVDGPLTIDEAVAYAIKFNLDVRVQRMEEDLAQNQLLLTKFNMLPRLNAEASLSSRDNEVGARSEEISTGRQNLSFSRSAEDDTQSARLEMSYNLLDYGLNYVRAQQDANRIQVAHERRKAAINALVRDARVTYMRAAVAQKIEKEVADLVDKAQSALDRSKQAYKQQLGVPLENLAYQRDLVVSIRSLKKLQADLATAKAQLASLLNIRMGQKFELSAPDIDREAPVKIIRPDLEQLEVYAVVNRPELAEADFKMTIEKLEKRLVWMSMLPIIEPQISYNYDQNQFLLNNGWLNVSARIAYSLMQPFTLPTKLKDADDKMAYVTLQRDAMTLSVLSQVNIAYIQHLAAVDSLKTSNELASIEGKISTQIGNAVSTKSMSEQDGVLAEAKALRARVENDLDYIDVDRSVSQLMTAIGYTVVPENIDDYKTEELADLINKNTGGILSSNEDIPGSQDLHDMAFDASYATKSGRPWFVRTGPFKTQDSVQQATQKIATVLMGINKDNQADFMPPVPYVRLDEGDLGHYYLAFDDLNTITAQQVCDAFTASEMSCEMNSDPMPPVEKKEKSFWNFWSSDDSE